MERDATEGTRLAPAQPTHYVGVGASAGGLEAIESFFGQVPAATGMAFVVVQHLSPDYKSLMVELLSKRTRLRVVRAENNQTVEPDTVYLIPPKQNLTIFHGKLLLRAQEPSHGINLPIDIFLRSLAEDQEDRAVGIVLSGTGSDGMHGIRAIKEAGGLVMVQAPESARFDGMPNSAISTGMADFVLSPEDMPQTLLSYAKHPFASPAGAEPAVAEEGDWLPRILALLRQEKKLDFTNYKPTTILRRVHRRMSIHQIHDPHDYVRYLESYPQEVHSLFRDLLIGVTNFFRNPEVFAALEKQYLPALFDRLDGREARFWVAGCSTGEEAYTLAMLVLDHQRETGRQHPVKIFATDIDADALFQAGNGEFPESSAADLTQERLTRYFTREGDRFKVSRKLREMVVFARHNLIKDPPFTKIDLVSCRNLLIYLQPVLQRRILEKFNFSLSDGGLLVLGGSESVGEMDGYLEPLDGQLRIYRSRGKALPPGGTGTAASAEPWRRDWDRRPAGRVREVGESPPRLFERVLEEAATGYLPLTLVVNERREILHTFGDSQPLLRIPPGKVANDVVRMAHPDLAVPLSTALQRAQHAREEVAYRNVRVGIDGRTQAYRLRVRPLAGMRHVEPMVAIYLEREESGDGGATPEAEPYDLDRDAQRRIQDLEQELQFTRENLQATIEELETANEELQATNEELMASNEELQSTNEELQSVNEELFTVNAEHQTKILELTETTNDLDNLLSSTEIGVMFLDENLDLRRFTPGAARILHLRDGDLERPLGEIASRLGDVDLSGAVEAVRRTGRARREEVAGENGTWYLMQILPYLVGPSEPAGVVVTFVDISRLKQAETARDQSVTNYRVLFESIPSGVALQEFVFAEGEVVDCRFVDVNPAFARLTGLSRDEIRGRRLAEVAGPTPPPSLRWFTSLGASVAAGETVQRECTCSCPDGQDGCRIQAFRVSPRRFVTILDPEPSRSPTRCIPEITRPPASE